MKLQETFKFDFIPVISKNKVGLHYNSSTVDSEAPTPTKIPDKLSSEYKMSTGFHPPK
jgi:hypothetical protein